MDTPGPFEANILLRHTHGELADEQKEEWLGPTSGLVSIHEAYPGRSVQFLHLNASSRDKGRKDFRQLRVR